MSRRVTVTLHLKWPPPSCHKNATKCSFFGRVKSRGLKVALNLHAASGKMLFITAPDSIYMTELHGAHITEPLLLLLHVYTGIQPWEEKYVEMAEAMGIDPKVDNTIVAYTHSCLVISKQYLYVQTHRYVPFVPSDKKVSSCHDANAFCACTEIHCFAV